MVPMNSGISVPIPMHEDSPQRRQLRTEVNYMEMIAQQTMAEVMNEARDALQLQQATFQRVARDFEQQARDVNQAEQS